MKQNITDEQLARYMSGLSDLKEESEVLEALSHDDESIEDFANMVAAVELQLDSERKAKPSIFSRWQYWSAAAVLLLLVGSAVLFWNRSSVVINQAPVYAAQDTIDQDSIQDFEMNYTTE